MVDTLTKSQRSRVMSKIRGKDTKPELAVRSLLHGMGYRFRLHRRDLPGSPDIVLPRYRAVVFVHGCFWHRHDGCNLAYHPKTNVDFWEKKFQANVERDLRNLQELEKDGWKVLIIWECELSGSDALIRLEAGIRDGGRNVD